MSEQEKEPMPWRDSMFTMQEVADALRTAAPIMQQVLKSALADETLWVRREELYRTTFLLGHFRWYRRFRVWWLRRQIGF